MSYHKDIGDAALFVYNFSHNINRRPYLRRNVREVLGALTMGSTISTLRTTIGARGREEVMASDDEEDERQRPAKRRKLSGDDEGALHLSPMTTTSSNVEDHLVR